MFSYRHAFHAGNHADVLKHAMFVHILDYFGRKPAPYWVIDTHAGAGLYGLQGEASTKTAEAADGIGRLWDGLSLPPLIQRYLQALAEFNPTGALKVYPGSPWWTLKYMRAADRLRLFEWHPTEAEVLAGNLGQLARAVQRRVMLYHADGFQPADIRAEYRISGRSAKYSPRIGFRVPTEAEMGKNSSDAESDP